ncbi:MAG: hypothetical protein QM804_04070 [Propionicimonas sp.]
MATKRRKPIQKSRKKARARKQLAPTPHWTETMDPLRRLVLCGQLELLLTDLREQIANLPTTPSREEH